jgi:hypothetical protein
MLPFQFNVNIRFPSPSCLRLPQSVYSEMLTHFSTIYRGDLFVSHVGSKYYVTEWTPAVLFSQVAESQVKI